MKLIFLFSLLSSILLAGCGGGGNGQASTKSKLSFTNYEDLKQMYDAQKVICLDSSCPGYVAKIAFMSNTDEGYSLGFCSGTLFQNKYIITNSHCIPEALKASGSDCSDSITAIFPQTAKYVSQKVRCSRIIQAYDQQKTGPDLAVFELQSFVARESVNSVRTGGFLENANVYAYTMNPTTNTLGTLVKKTCKLSTNNIITMSKDRFNDRGLIYG